MLKKSHILYPNLYIHGCGNYQSQNCYRTNPIWQFSNELTDGWWVEGIRDQLWVTEGARIADLHKSHLNN
jgi:hypothetical protein